MTVSELRTILAGAPPEWNVMVHVNGFQDNVETYGVNLDYDSIKDGWVELQVGQPEEKST